MIDLAKLNDDQRTIVTTLDRPLFVAAGAGSGKTFTLTRRIAFALTPESGTDGTPYLSGLDQALIITFTEKAATEIRERVRSTLRSVGLTAAALDVDSAWIGTIHGMCSRILHRHALELGIDPGFQMASDADAKTYLNLSLIDVLTRARRDPAYANLFSLIEGAGGTSRLRVGDLITTIITRAQSSVEGFDSIDWMGEPEDPAAALRRLASALEPLINFGCKREDELARLTGIVGYIDELTNSLHLDAADAWAFVSGIKPPNGTYWRAADIAPLCKDAKVVFAEVNADILMAYSAQFIPQLMALARAVDDGYRQLKSAHGVLDNDDLVRLAYQAVRDHPRIRDAYADQFRLVMVDEFQDTSLQQVEFVKLLSGVDACHLTTVGDAQQSIYRFRGADVSVFQRREAEAREGSSQLVRLDTNFRSHDDVLRFVALACGQAGLVADFMDLKDCGSKRDCKYGKCTLPRINIEVTRGDSAKVKGRAHVPGVERLRMLNAMQIVDRLVAYRDAGISPGRMAILMRSIRGVELYLDALRAHGMECVVTGGSGFADAPEVRMVASLLCALANPHDTSSGLYPVLTGDIFGLDADDLVALGTRPRSDCDLPGKRPIDRGLTDMAGEEPAFMPGVVPSPRLVVAQQVMARAAQRMGSQNVADVMLGVVRESGWLARLEAAGTQGGAQASNVLAAIAYVRELTVDGGMGAARASQEFSYWLECGKRKPTRLKGDDGGVVTIMTVHASKGLEFPIVALPGVLDASVKPRSVFGERLVNVTEGERVRMSLAVASLKTELLKVLEEGEPARGMLDWRLRLARENFEADLAECGRLAYVALTRAKEALIVGTCFSTKADGTVETETLATEVLAQLLGPGVMASAGETTVEYGGSEPAPCRCCAAHLSEDGTSLEVTGPLDSIAGIHSADVRALSASLAPRTQAADPADFTLYEMPQMDETIIRSRSPYDDVFSFSSTHDQDLGLQGPRQVSVSDTELVDEDTVPVTPSDPDHATALGSAFHELAQYAIVTGLWPDESRVDSSARSWKVTRAQRPRLDAALARWRDSGLRSELLSHERVLAEVPFFQQVDGSEFGQWRTGAIDALGIDAASDHAFVVDYKTGDLALDADQLREAHVAQASFYADVLRQHGFTSVTCVFVCVEREDAGGEPVQIRYEF